MNYRQQTLSVMNRVEMIVALYDGMIRFLHGAIACMEKGDVEGRRKSIGRVLEILVYLQARLRPDVGGQPASSLAEFYAAMYAQCVRASRDASIELCEQSIRDIRNVRDAWQIAANDESAAAAMPGISPVGSSSGHGAFHPIQDGSAVSTSNRWSA